MAAAGQTSWCSSWVCLYPPLPPTDPGFPWPSWSGTEVLEQGCPSQTAARPAAALASAVPDVVELVELAAAAPTAGPPSSVWAG